MAMVLGVKLSIWRTSHGHHPVIISGQSPGLPSLRQCKPATVDTLYQLQDTADVLSRCHACAWCTTVSQADCRPVKHTA